MNKPFGPQPVPEDKRIFDRPSNQQPISKFFDETAQAVEDTERQNEGEDYRRLK